MKASLPCTETELGYLRNFRIGSRLTASRLHLIPPPQAARVVQNPRVWLKEYLLETNRLGDSAGRKLQVRRAMVD